MYGNGVDLGLENEHVCTKVLSLIAPMEVHILGVGGYSDLW